MSPMQVEIVGPDRNVWSGEASMVIATTIEGEIGILTGHEPTLAVLVNGVVQIAPTDGETVHAAVLGGFLSVADDQVSILAESASLSGDISAGDAESELRAAARADDAEGAARARARMSAAAGRLR